MKAYAEWQEQECLMISLPHQNTDWKDYLDDILKAYLNFAKAVSKYQKLLIIHSKQTDLTEFKKLENVDFFEYECDDTWIRDYGGIDAKDDKDIISYDFLFNAWGGKFGFLKDNALNATLYKNYFKTPLKSIDLILEGGSVEFNTKDFMLTTTTCLLNDNRNKLDKNDLEKKLKELFGLKHILWLEHGYIKGDDTDSHVDTLARFLNDTTIAYASCDDENDEHFKELKAMEYELKKYAREFGFELVALPLPKPNFYENKKLPFTYLNFVFINGALIVPTYNDKNDEVVLEKLKKVVKDRDIVGVDSTVFCRQNGSLHCSCMNRYKR